MNTPPPIPPVIGPSRTLSYELTRGDLFANVILILFRNRLVQVIFGVALLFNGYLILAPGFATRSLGQTLWETVAYLTTFFLFIAAFQCLFGLANAYLFKHRGVVGRHTLEITEAGLVERTEFNETLHRWPSICRVLSLAGYVFIYVSDTNSHQVPKRCFAPEELEAFLSDVRRYTQK